jgi:hypothetical protein
MPKAIDWTDEQDTEIRTMRADGELWDSIAEAVGTTRWQAIERGRAIGVMCAYLCLSVLICV